MSDFNIEVKERSAIGNMKVITGTLTPIVAKTSPFELKPQDLDLDAFYDVSVSLNYKSAFHRMIFNRHRNEIARFTSTGTHESAAIVSSGTAANIDTNNEVNFFITGY